MATELSERVLEELLEDKGEVPFDEATQEIGLRCDVKQSTAEAYVRTSEIATKRLTANNEEMVVPVDQAAKKAASKQGGVIEDEVGSRTGGEFGSLPKLRDEGHPEIPRAHETGYIRRRMGDSPGGLGSKTDVAVVTAAMADPDFSTLLIGKHGVGKDKLVLHICANTNRPVIRLVGNDDPDFVDLLVGTYSPDDNGDFRFKKGLLSIAIENGYTFVLDEFNSLSGKVQTMLNKILEDSDQSQLVIPETNEIITPHEEFNFVATMNPNEIGYGGREDLDQATASRFIPIELPPLGEDGEKRVVAGETNWDEDEEELESLLGENGVVSNIRTLHTEMGKVSTWISTRDVIQIGRMAEQLNSVKAASEAILVGRADPEDKKAIKDAIQDKRW